MPTLDLRHDLYELDVDHKMMQLLVDRTNGIDIPVSAAFVYTLCDDLLEWFATRTQDYKVFTGVDPEFNLPCAKITIDDDLVALEFKLRWA